MAMSKKARHEIYIRFLKDFLLPEGDYHGFLSDDTVDEFHRMCDGVQAIYETDVEERELGWYRKNVKDCSLSRAKRIVNIILDYIKRDFMLKKCSWNEYVIPRVEEEINN